MTPGFKATPFGPLSEDWHVTEIGWLQPFITSGSRGWAAFYADSGAAFLRITNLSREWIYPDLSSVKYVRLPPGATEALRTEVERGDVLISITADIGIIGYVNDAVPLPAYINQHIALVRLDHAVIDSKFVSYFLASEGPQKRFRALTDQGAKAGMSLLTVERIELALPPLVEQRAISSALSDVDGLIAGLEQLISRKCDLKQAAMEQLLTGRTRLPGFSATWQQTRLGEVADIISGGTPRTSQPAYWEGNIKWCTPTDITATSGKYLWETERTISAAGLSSCSAQLLPVGALLLCTRATIGEVKIAAREVCTNQGFKSLIVQEGISNEFMYYLLLTKKPQMVQRAIGSTFLEISKRDTASLPLNVPPLDEQEAIAAVLSDMDAEIAALEQRLAKTRALKQGMMQELLTGRIRLVPARAAT